MAEKTTEIVAEGKPRPPNLPRSLASSLSCHRPSDIMKKHVSCMATGEWAILDISRVEWSAGS
jgi:hypothetical protein